MQVPFPHTLWDRTHTQAEKFFYFFFLGQIQTNPDQWQVRLMPLVPGISERGDAPSLAGLTAHYSPTSTRVHTHIHITEIWLSPAPFGALCRQKLNKLQVQCW